MNQNINDDALQQVYEKLPCRKGQIDILNSFFKFTTVPANSLIIYGRASTGKTSAVSFVLSLLKVKFVLVNCIECDSSRLVYEFILDEISGHQPTSQNNYSHYVHCDNANDFIRHLNAEMDRLQMADQPLYIVLKNAEHLRKISGNTIPVLLRLRELSEQNVNTVFLSGIHPEKLYSSSGITDVHLIYFPEYTKDELVQILMKDYSHNYSLNFYSNYLKLVLSVFYSVCRNLREIRYIVSKNFPLYIEPILKGELNETDIARLWKNIEPHLKSNLHQVYLRDSNSSSDERCPSKFSDIWRIELPFYSKYLLIAAYLASYNPAKLDKQFFLKKHDKVSKRMKLSRQKRKAVSFHLLGPKPFPLERLVAIFCSIVDDSNALKLPIFSQISSLVSLNFLQKIGNKDLFDSPKFKCLVSLDVIRNIARSVDFTIDRYLYDFI